MGDWPSEVRLNITFEKGKFHPIWKLANALQFDGNTFVWRDLQKVRRRKSTKK